MLALQVQQCHWYWGTQQRQLHSTTAAARQLGLLITVESFSGFLQGQSCRTSHTLLLHGRRMAACMRNCGIMLIHTEHACADLANSPYACFNHLPYVIGDVLGESQH